MVSGFLGSGKTTLVRHLLDDAQRNGVRLAIVSNEFGELGIDAALLGQSGEAYVEIEGGCVCCQLSDELVATLQTLRERVRPDRIVIETSGVALPYDTQLQLMREPVASWLGDDVAVVVVNAEQLAAGRDLAGTFEDQVSSADLLLLNKLDLVSEQAVSELERRLADYAPGTPIVGATHGSVDARLFFAPDLAAARVERRPEPHVHENFRADALEVEAGVASAELVERLTGLGALRVKGFVETAEGLRLVQGVGPRVELSPVDVAPRPDLVGHLVLILRAR